MSTLDDRRLHDTFVDGYDVIDLFAPADQLQSALDSRVLIEQAKGFLSHRLNISVDDAFAALRNYARTTNTRIAAVAAGVIEDGLVP
ncbi:ANTAR domain-containing protein [Nonomuraea endophytica]|uniref:AmiR/NasT family two-component response regulator n=1 Tax=Nonomuraea endophytica TaxID=714136 RepID=A0A7W8EJX7_9ACTN|nr:ANTAR domain-containing protein [Nonomuraea endophytica]MBB5082043.1 AmiR/NasT family two-component response regulator [Nonomuraea endophytica]